MSQSTLTNETELGRWIGRREAAQTLASHCDAGAVESLRAIRDQKLYTEVAPTWDAFCRTYVPFTRRHADRLISYLEAYGPDYFYIARITGISPADFAHIAPFVANGAITLDGVTLALIPENEPAIIAAVRAQLRQVRAAQPESFDRLFKRVRSIGIVLFRYNGAVTVAEREKLQTLLRNFGHMVAKLPAAGPAPRA